MSERVFDDPTLPPPGRRSGAGSASIVPYLLKTLATRPQATGVEATPRPASAPVTLSAPRASGGASEPA